MSMWSNEEEKNAIAIAANSNSEKKSSRKCASEHVNEAQFCERVWQRVNVLGCARELRNIQNFGQILYIRQYFKSLWKQNAAYFNWRAYFNWCNVHTSCFALMISQMEWSIALQRYFSFKLRHCQCEHSPTVCACVRVTVWHLCNDIQYCEIIFFQFWVSEINEWEPHKILSNKNGRTSPAAMNRLLNAPRLAARCIRYGGYFNQLMDFPKLAMISYRFMF